MIAAPTPNRRPLRSPCAPDQPRSAAAADPLAQLPTARTWRPRRGARATISSIRSTAASAGGMARTMVTPAHSGRSSPRGRSAPAPLLLTGAVIDPIERQLATGAACTPVRALLAAPARSRRRPAGRDRRMPSAPGSRSTTQVLVAGQQDAQAVRDQILDPEVAVGISSCTAQGKIRTPSKARLSPASWAAPARAIAATTAGQ